MNQQTFEMRIECPVCHKQKPEDLNNEHDTVHLRWDWRKADRPKLEDKIPESPMCLECYNRIVDEYSPKAPWWDEDGVKHPWTDPNPKRTNESEKQNEIQETIDRRRLRYLQAGEPLPGRGEKARRDRLESFPESALDKRRHRRLR